MYRNNNIVRWYHQGFTYCRIRELYQLNFPLEGVPSLWYIGNTIDKFEDGGTFEDMRRYNHTEINLEQHQSVLQAVIGNKN